jgi:hypothetical protein
MFEGVLYSMCLISTVLMVISKVEINRSSTQKLADALDELAKDIKGQGQKKKMQKLKEGHDDSLKYMKGFISGFDAKTGCLNKIVKILNEEHDWVKSLIEPWEGRVTQKEKC